MHNIVISLSLLQSLVVEYDESVHSEDNDGVQICPMSVSVTEQADSRFADPAAHITHTRLCSSSGSSRHCDVVEITVLPPFASGKLAIK